MAQSLLMQLGNPKDTEYLVGIINRSAESGALLSPNEPSPRAESFNGYSTARGSNAWLTLTATELLGASVYRRRLEVMRKFVSAEACPQLEDAVIRFYIELDRVLQTPISLTALPPERRPETITLDGTSYVLQIWTGERTLVIYPDRDIDKALDEVSSVLLATIGECSRRLPGKVEEHYVR